MSNAMTPKNVYLDLSILRSIDGLVVDSEGSGDQPVAYLIALGVEMLGQTYGEFQVGNSDLIGDCNGVHILYNTDEIVGQSGELL